MRENWVPIHNVWNDLPDCDCFVCSPSHQWGFRLDFFFDPDENAVVSPVPPVKEGMAGFPGIVHGGFQAMLMDEIMCWAVLHGQKKTCFTGKMETRFARPVKTGREFLVWGRLTRPGRRASRAEAWIEEDGQVLASGGGTLVIPTVEEFSRNTGCTDIPDFFMEYLG